MTEVFETKTQSTVYLKWVNYIIYELYPNKAVYLVGKIKL